MEGVGKRHNTLNPPLVIGEGQTEAAQYAVKSKQTAEEVPGTVDEFPDLSNRGDVNRERKWMGWTVIKWYNIRCKIS